MTAEAAVVEPIPDSDVNDDLRSAFAAVKSAPTATAVTEAVIQPAAETPAATPGDRPRDDKGRFANPEAVTPQPKEGAAAASVVAEKGGTEQVALPAVSPAPTAIKPPDMWPAPMKEKFSALDPEIQQQIVRRETEMHRKFTSQDEDRNFGKQIREITAPYAAVLNAEGATPQDAYKQFLNYAYVMRTGTAQQKAAAIGAIAQTYNINLGQPLQQAQVDPNVSALQQRLDQIERDRQAEIQQRKSEEQSALEAKIQTFAAEPGHEHFDIARPLMGTLLESGQAKDLPDAYEKAIWSLPEIRSTLLAQRARELEEKRITEAKAKTDAARFAAGSVTGGPGAARAANGSAPIERSLDEELRANFRAAQGRV